MLLVAKIDLSIKYILSVAGNPPTCYSIYRTNTQKGYKVKKVYVDELPVCDFCPLLAAVDGKTEQGPWANMCRIHFEILGVGLGLGKGQALVVKKG
jgi:hypothetical protein